MSGIGCLTGLPSSSGISLPGYLRRAYGFLLTVRFGFCAIWSFSPSCSPRVRYSSAYALTSFCT